MDQAFRQRQRVAPFVVPLAVDQPLQQVPPPAVAVVVAELFLQAALFAQLHGHEGVRGEQLHRLLLAVLLLGLARRRQAAQAQHHQRQRPGAPAQAQRGAALADASQAQLQVPAFQMGALIQIEGEGGGHVQRLGDGQHQIPEQIAQGPVQAALLAEPDAELQVELPRRQGDRQQNQRHRHQVFQGEQGKGERGRALAGGAQQHGDASGRGVAAVAFQLPDTGEHAPRRAQPPPGELAEQPVQAVLPEAFEQGPGAGIVAEQGAAVERQQRPLPQRLEPPEQQHRPDALPGGGEAGQHHKGQPGEHHPHHCRRPPPAPVQPRAHIHGLPAGARRQAGVELIQVHAALPGAAGRRTAGTAPAAPSRRRRRRT